MAREGEGGEWNSLSPNAASGNEENAAFLEMFPSALWRKGASRYDVHIEGGRGSLKSGHSKAGCVNFIV